MLFLYLKRGQGLAAVSPFFQLLFFFLVNKQVDVCGCERGTCDCNKDTQTSFCVCFKGFEGI